MASRKQLWHPDETKKRIQTSQLINRLTMHALSDAPLMDASQVAAARALIDKVLPNAKQEVEVSGGLEVAMPAMIALVPPGDDSKD